MSDHDCEHIKTITEIQTDVRWIVKDIKRRNGLFDKHVVDSEDFRLAVNRNTIWRHIFKGFCLLATGVTGGMMWAWFYHLSCVQGVLMSKCKTEVFTRVTGFFRPVQAFNPGKTEEVKERKQYDLNEVNYVRENKT